MATPCVSRLDLHPDDDEEDCEQMIASGLPTAKTGAKIRIRRLITMDWVDKEEGMKNGNGGLALSIWWNLRMLRWHRARPSLAFWDF
jgi:hypothetical protein